MALTNKSREGWEKRPTKTQLQTAIKTSFHIHFDCRYSFQGDENKRLTDIAYPFIGLRLNIQQLLLCI